MSVSETIENLERVLKQADLVKFAKSKPLDLKPRIETKSETILTLDNAIPVEVPEEEDTLLNKRNTKTSTNSAQEKETNVLL
jgi:hypothetical protein